VIFGIGLKARDETREVLRLWGSWILISSKYPKY
jgi:hypothetical protein